MQRKHQEQHTDLYVHPRSFWLPGLDTRKSLPVLSLFYLFPCFLHLCLHVDLRRFFCLSLHLTFLECADLGVIFFLPLFDECGVVCLVVSGPGTRGEEVVSRVGVSRRWRWGSE